MRAGAGERWECWYKWWESKRWEQREKERKGTLDPGKERRGGVRAETKVRRRRRSVVRWVLIYVGQRIGRAEVLLGSFLIPPLIRPTNKTYVV